MAGTGFRVRACSIELVFDTGAGLAPAGSEKVIAPLNRMGGIGNQS